MIKNFEHKGLEKFYETGSTAGINPDFVRRIRRILLVLDEAVEIKNVDIPGYNLHSLKGDLGGYWSVKVNKNWRIIFRFENENVYDVDLIDYH